MQHLMWKDYRQIRGYWLAFLLGLPAIELVVVLTNGLLFSDWTFNFDFSSTVMILAIVSILYLIGSAAILFAGESENKTTQLLANLPVNAGPHFFAKILCLVISTIALLGLLWCWHWPIIGRITAVELHGKFPWLIIAFLSVDVLVVSVCVSLCVSSAVLAMFLSFVAIGLSITFFVLMVQFAHISEPWSVYLVGLLQIAVLFLVDLRLATRWLHRSKQVPAVGEWRTRMAKPLEELRPERLDWMRVSHPFLALLWHQWRQARWLIPLVLFAGILQAALLNYLEMFALESPSGAEGFQLAVPVAAFCGICAFITDRRNQSLAFFAAHPVSPLMIWWSRHLVWLPITLLWVLGMVFLENRLNRWNLDYVLTNVEISLACYSAAQLVSFFCKSPVIGFGLGIASGTAATTWSIQTMQSQVPLTLTTLPLIIAFLGTTAICSADRMLERHCLAARARAILPSALAIGFAILTATAYRP